MKGQAIFKIFYYKTQHGAHRQFPPNTVKHTLLDTVPSRSDFSENLSSLFQENRSREWNGEKASHQDAAPTLQEHSPAEVDTHGQGWGPPRAGAQVWAEMRWSGDETPTAPASGRYFLFLGFSSSAALRRKM